MKLVRKDDKHTAWVLRIRHLGDVFEQMKLAHHGVGIGRVPGFEAKDYEWRATKREGEQIDRAAIAMSPVLIPSAWAGVPKARNFCGVEIVARAA